MKLVRIYFKVKTVYKEVKTVNGFCENSELPKTITYRSTVFVNGKASSALKLLDGQ